MKKKNKLGFQEFSDFWSKLAEILQVWESRGLKIKYQMFFEGRISSSIFNFQRYKKTGQLPCMVYWRTVVQEECATLLRLLIWSFLQFLCWRLQRFFKGLVLNVLTSSPNRFLNSVSFICSLSACKWTKTHFVINNLDEKKKKSNVILFCVLRSRSFPILFASFAT